jgi:hypothetical protein
VVSRSLILFSLGVVSVTVSKAATILLVAACIFGVLLFYGHVGSSVTRVKREHGLQLPASACGLVCAGDAWKSVFSDCGAIAAFEMTSAELQPFLSQLKIHDTHEGGYGPGYTNCIFPLYAPYHISEPWISGEPLKTYGCASPTGSSLYVQTWRIDDARTGICLYTDWN